MRWQLHDSDCVRGFRSCREHERLRERALSQNGHLGALHDLALEALACLVVERLQLLGCLCLQEEQRCSKLAAALASEIASQAE